MPTAGVSISRDTSPPPHPTPTFPPQKKKKCTLFSPKWAISKVARRGGGGGIGELPPEIAALSVSKIQLQSKNN